MLVAASHVSRGTSATSALRHGRSDSTSLSVNAVLCLLAVLSCACVTDGGSAPAAAGAAANERVVAVSSRRMTADGATAKRVMVTC